MSVALALSPALDQLSLDYDQSRLHVPLEMLAGVHSAVVSSDWVQDPGSEVSAENTARTLPVEQRSYEQDGIKNRNNLWCRSDWGWRGG